MINIYINNIDERITNDLNFKLKYKNGKIIFRNKDYFKNNIFI